MDNFKRFMTFSRGERIAIITIVSMIVIMLIAKYLIIKNPPKRDYFKHDLDSIVARREAVLDSLRTADSLSRLSKASRSSKNTTTQRNTVYRTTKPVIQQDTIVKKSYHNAPTIINLNTADTTQFKQLPGIGSSFAKWIVSYRERLGGYCETEQLLEVYHMDSARYNEFKNFVKIDSLFIPEKLKINYETFKSLLRHPYLEYDDVKKIVNHREHKGLITSWQQLEQVLGDGANPRLKYYIDFE